MQGAAFQASEKKLTDGESVGKFVRGTSSSPEHFEVVEREPKNGSHRDWESAMLPTQQVCLERIQFCISDLSENGIDLLGANSRLRARLVREHLEYFQMMLGYDSDP